MDFLLKRYFWIVNLVAVGLCAGLAARATSHYVEQLIEQDGAGAPTGRRFLPPPSDKVRSKDAETIIKRDVFCSTCAPVVPVDHPLSEGTVDNTPQKTSLQIELVSTMVVPSDERWSSAVIRDLTTKDHEPSLYQRGSKLPGGTAEVLRVIEKKVYLKNAGRIEYLDLEGEAPPRAAGPAMPPPPMASNSGDPLDDAIGTHVRCTGAACEVDRALVDQMLTNPTSLATAARFVPSIKDGHPNGFKLYAIRPSSIFGRIGLQNGDTIRQINGMEMSSPDQALTVYTKLRTASHLSVAVERRGENVTLDYTIR